MKLSRVNFPNRTSIFFQSFLQFNLCCKSHFNSYQQRRMVYICRPLVFYLLMPSFEVISIIYSLHEHICWNVVAERTNEKVPTHLLISRRSTLVYDLELYTHKYIQINWNDWVRKSEKKLTTENKPQSSSSQSTINVEFKCSEMFVCVCARVVMLSINDIRHYNDWQSNCLL